MHSYVTQSLEGGRGEVGAGNLAHSPPPHRGVEVELCHLGQVGAQRAVVDGAAHAKLAVDRGPSLQHQEQQVHLQGLGRFRRVVGTCTVREGQTGIGA